MVSRFVRRSGVSVCTLAEWLEWVPRKVYQIGVGLTFPEVAVMRENWPHLEFEAMEPHPWILHALTKRKRHPVHQPIKDSSYPGWLWPFAAGARDGRGVIYTGMQHKDGATLHRRYDKESDAKRQALRIRVRKIDTVWPDGPSCRDVLLWIDCEGSELAALRGAERFIEGVDWVNVEITARRLADTWSDPVAVHNWLEAHGFVLQHIHSQRSSSGQGDIIYVRPKYFREAFCTCPIAIKQWRENHR